MLRPSCLRFFFFFCRGPNPRNNTRIADMISVWWVACNWIYIAKTLCSLSVRMKLFNFKVNRIKKWNKFNIRRYVWIYRNFNLELLISGISNSIKYRICYVKIYIFFIQTYTVRKKTFAKTHTTLLKRYTPNVWKLFDTAIGVSMH